MASYLASIFGTEQDKASYQLYPTYLLKKVYLTNSSHTGQLLLLLQNRRLPPRRPLLTQTCQALLLANDPHAQPVPKPSLRPQESHERQPAAKSL